jgi:hypothetical protein
VRQAAMRGVIFCYTAEVNSVGPSVSGDSLVIIQLATQFHSQFLEAIQTFNEQQSVRTDATEQEEAMTKFIQQQDALVAQTQAALLARLEPQDRKN